MPPEEKQKWPVQVWIGLAGDRPYLGKHPSVLGESGPVHQPYFRASRLSSPEVVEAVARSLFNNCDEPDYGSGQHNWREPAKHALEAARSAIEGGADE